MDEYDIDISIRKISKNNFMSICRDHYGNEYPFHRNPRQEALIKAAEKAFERLEDNNEKTRKK